MQSTKEFAYQVGMDKFFEFCVYLQNVKSELPVVDEATEEFVNQFYSWYAMTELRNFFEKIMYSRRVALGKGGKFRQSNLVSSNTLRESMQSQIYA